MARAFTRSEPKKLYFFESFIVRLTLMNKAHNPRCKIQFEHVLKKSIFHKQFPLTIMSKLGTSKTLTGFVLSWEQHVAINVPLWFTQMSENSSGMNDLIMYYNVFCLLKWQRKCLTNSMPSLCFFFQNFKCPSWLAVMIKSLLNWIYSCISF